MLSSIRKFSSSIYSKIFLIIVAIPFIFWGMGDLFSSGNLNTIAKIGNNKVSSKEFVNYIQNNSQQLDTLNSQVIESLLYSFVGQKLLEKEIEDFEIMLTDKSLASKIKNEKLFIKDNKFSRTEYEKFLLSNNINAAIYEQYILKQETRQQLLDLIGGGIIPSEFMINLAYNKIKQERKIKLINLNKVFKKQIGFTEDEIKLYFANNIKKFQDIHRTIKYIELKPEVLIGKDDFNSLFFKKIDELDDLIVEGKNLEYLTQEYNLGKSKELVFNQNGNIIKQENKNEILEKFIQKISNIDESEPTVLIENENTFLIIELFKTQNIEKKVTDNLVQIDIKKELKKNYKRKEVSKLISQIGSKNFNKENFYNFSRKENAKIEDVFIKSLNDDSYLKLDLVGQIYSSPKDKVIVISDIGLAEVFLVHIEEIINKSISKDSEDYDKFFKLAKTTTSSSLFNSYDNYLKNKYEIDINYKALEQISNSF